MVDALAKTSKLVADIALLAFWLPSRGYATPHTSPLNPKSRLILQQAATLQHEASVLFQGDSAFLKQLPYISKYSHIYFHQIRKPVKERVKINTEKGSPKRRSSKFLPPGCSIFYKLASIKHPSRSAIYETVVETELPFRGRAEPERHEQIEAARCTCRSHGSACRTSLESTPNRRWRIRTGLEDGDDALCSGFAVSARPVEVFSYGDGERAGGLDSHGYTIVRHTDEGVRSTLGDGGFNLAGLSATFDWRAIALLCGHDRKWPVSTRHLSPDYPNTRLAATKGENEGWPAHRARPTATPPELGWFR